MHGTSCAYAQCPLGHRTLWHAWQILPANTSLHSTQNRAPFRAWNLSTHARPFAVIESMPPGWRARLNSFVPDAFNR